MSFRICSFLVMVFAAIGATRAQNSEQSQSSATAVAKASFLALKSGDIAKFVSLFHPSEFERFKSFATKVAQQKSPDAEDKQLLPLFAPHDTYQGIQKARGDELLIAFLENTFKQQADLKETLSQL